MDIKKLGIEISHDSKHAKLLQECYEYAERSYHIGTHNAAFLADKSKVVLRGLNILPQRVKKLKERLEGVNKHIYPNHAERDVIYKAASKGIATKGLTMVMPWLPCIPCANAIITAGIKKLIVHKQMAERTKEKWQEELKNAVQIMKEASVKIIAYDGYLGVKAFMHRQEWEA
jgi:dCMP deaminase